MRPLVHNLSCENEFYLHENEKSFPYQRLSTEPHFGKDTGRNLKMAYYQDPLNKGIQQKMLLLTLFIISYTRCKK